MTNEVVDVVLQAGTASRERRTETVAYAESMTHENAERAVSIWQEQAGDSDVVAEVVDTPQGVRVVFKFAAA